VISFSLAYEDSGRSDPLEKMGRFILPQEGFTSRVVDIFSHAGYYTI